MAVTLPSDLIADVMRAANPSHMRTAAARLNGGEQSRIAFNGVMEGLAQSSKVRDRTDDLIADVLAAANNTEVIAAETKLAEFLPVPRAVGAASPEPYRAFEQMVLRNMFESMMPSADSGIYGEGSSAGIWRSLANDQLASVYSSWGGLGIARTLSDSEDSAGVSTKAQWPYFETSAIQSFTG